MSNARSQETTSRLRTIIATIDHDIGQTPATMQKAWAELVDVLSLGPEPETRECPTCHTIGMRAASRCSQCWSALAPLPPSEVTA